MLGFFHAYWPCSGLRRSFSLIPSSHQAALPAHGLVALLLHLKALHCCRYLLLSKLCNSKGFTCRLPKARRVRKWPSSHLSNGCELSTKKGFLLNKSNLFPHGYVFQSNSNPLKQLQLFDMWLEVHWQLNFLSLLQNQKQSQASF